MRIRRTKVTVVKEHVFTYTEDRTPIRIKCNQCSAMTRMVRLDEAGVASGASLQEIRREVEASGLHYLEEPNGSLLICLGSLVR
jgi:hypothetical protein